ncbi:hypothetical protein LBMAG56_26830 [Verrucomicrobiota bacterium]|nr:hypothetical protein LBMAG56_26830 [Verrucomicrobiota bacterium]
MGLDTVELVMAVEEEFDLAISAAAAAKMKRVGDLHAFVVTTLQQRAGAGVVDDAQVWERLRGIIVEQLGVRVEEVTPSARFLEDLRAD